ncbi:sigma-70 family RNA polymerase sigma factor [Flavobacteriaceae bacterium F08102]|nr:sigma-70 family RNA polymerase sigma factor [Flavobacteriaceae bacterium F08102]
MGNTLQKNNIQLVNAFKNNDQKVMQEVYQSIFLKFRSYVYKNNGDEAQAKDVFQDSFISCWRNVKNNKLRENSNLEAYLFTISKNKWTDYLRSTYFKKTISDDGVIEMRFDNEDRSDEEQEKKLKVLREALEQLGMACEKLLIQFYFERKSMDEISKDLQLSSASVRNKKYRCMEKLRALALKTKNNGYLPK